MEHPIINGNTCCDIIRGVTSCSLFPLDTNVMMDYEFDTGWNVKKDGYERHYEFDTGWV